MHIKLLIQISFIIFFVSFAFANDIVLKNNRATTELKIEVPNIMIENYSNKNNQIILEFKQDIKISLDNNLNNKFIEKIISEKNKFIIKLKNQPNVFIKPTKNEILIILSPTKKIKNIKLNSQIEKQIITKKNTFNKNPKVEKKLIEISNLIDEGQENLAIDEIKTLLNKYNSGYYAQEAMFKLGLAYMSLGEKSDKYYIEAASFFEQFIKEYPDNYHVPDALWKAAEAKEKAGIYYEAIFTYRKLLNLIPDTEIGKMALEEIGKIYFKIGQYDKAIDVYKEFIEKYKTRPNKILAYIGMAYAKMRNFSEALLYFSEVYNKGFDYTEFPPDLLYAMGETFELNKKNDEAISIYTRLYNLYPNDKNAGLAMYKAAVLIDKNGKHQLAKELLLECKTKFRTTKGALLSALYIAEKEKKNFSTEYWSEFLKDVLNNEIDVNLKTKAEILIIESLYREKRLDEALNKIIDFEQKFFDSPLLNKVYDIKQKIYIEQAREAFKLAQLDKSDKIVKKLVSEFPNTKYLDEAEKIIEQNKFSRIEKIFNDGNFLKTIKSIEEIYLNNKKIYLKNKWNNLLDEAYFAYIEKNIKSGNSEIVLIFSRQYLIDLPNGKYKDKIRKNLEKLIKDKIIELVKEKYFIKVVKFYEINKIWIQQSKDSDLKDTVKSYVAYSLYKLGENKTAEKIIKTIKNKKQKETSIIMFLLGINGSNFNINKLSYDELKFVVDELKYTKAMKILNELDKYTKNIKYKYQLKYSIIKTFKGKKLSDNLAVLYEEVNLLSEEIKRSVDDLFYEVGISFYEQKKYNKSYRALDEYLKLNINNSAKRARALYVAGVAALKEGLDIKARNYFEELIKKYPDSEFYSYAKSALEDMNWNKKLTK